MENAIARKLDPPEINPIEIESVLLNRLASVGQKSYAEHMGISESTVSRRKAEGYFCNMAKELAFLGIQAAPPEAVLVSRNYLTAVEILADAGLKAERAGRMRWGGAENDSNQKKAKAAVRVTNGFLVELTGSIHRSNYGKHCRSNQFSCA